MFHTSKTGSLFTSAFQICDSKSHRLSKSWGRHFYDRCYPLICEEDFRPLYRDNGAPCKSVRLVVAALILQAFFDYTDDETQHHIDFDLCWHLALGLDPCVDEDYVSQRTLQYFRAHLLTQDLIRRVFAEITEKIINVFGINTDKQRMDSTHILSNFAHLSRLRLFCETLRVFLRQLRQVSPTVYAQLPPSLRQRYHTAEGDASHYDDARGSDARRRLGVCARDAYRLCLQCTDGVVPELAESYVWLSRLIAEQCDLVDTPQTAEPGDADAELPAVPIQLKAAHAIDASVMQTPHDADVTYSGHKGQGYDALIVETYDEANPFQVITHGSLEPACQSDAERVLPTLAALDARGRLPEELLADTTFGSSENYVACARHGSELVAPTTGKASPPAMDASCIIEDSDFAIDVLGRAPTVCPHGITALSTTVAESRQGPVALIRMARAECARCPLAVKCARVPREAGVELIIVDLPAYTLAARRAQEDTDAFHDRYRPRAGIEGTNSELKRGHGLGKLRVRHANRVELALLLRLIACNMKRAMNYCRQQTKKQTTTLCSCAKKISIQKRHLAVEIAGRG